MKSVRDIMIETLQEFVDVRRHEPEILRALAERAQVPKKKPQSDVTKSRKEKRRSDRAGK